MPGLPRKARTVPRQHPIGQFERAACWEGSVRDKVHRKWRLHYDRTPPPLHITHQKIRNFIGLRESDARKPSKWSPFKLLLFCLSIQTLLDFGWLVGWLVGLVGWFALVGLVGLVG